MLRFIGAVACSILLCVQTAVAAPTTSPKDRVEIANAKVMELLLHEDFQNPQKKMEIIKKLEDEVVKFFDFNEFSSRTVGPRWRQFSDKQKVAFKDAFTELLRSSYIHTLDSYNGQSLVYVGEIRSADQTKVEVHTLFKNAENNYPVSFRMLIKNNEWVVYDVSVEGVSMIKNYREQFRDILASNSPDDLIKRVREKAEEKRQSLNSKEDKSAS